MSNRMIIPEELEPYISTKMECGYFDCRRRAKGDCLIFAETFDDGPLFYLSHRSCADGDNETVIFTVKQAIRMLRNMRTKGIFNWPEKARDHFFGRGGLNLDELRKSAARRAHGQSPNGQS